MKNIHLKDKKRFGKSVRLGEGDANFKVLFNFLNIISNLYYTSYTKPIHLTLLIIKLYNY